MPFIFKILLAIYKLNSHLSKSKTFCSLAFMKLEEYYRSSLYGTGIAIYLFLVIGLGLSILIYLLDDLLAEGYHYAAMSFMVLALVVMGLGEKASYSQKVKLYSIAMGLYFLEVLNELVIWQGGWGQRLHYYTQVNLFASMGMFWGFLYFSFRFLALIFPIRYAYLWFKLKSITPSNNKKYL